MGRPTDPLPAVVHAPEAFRAACDQARAQGRRVALVPTMGALHHALPPRHVPATYGPTH